MAPAPASWTSQNRLAEAYIDVGQPERAVEVLEESVITTVKSGSSTQLLVLANQKLWELGTSDSAS